MKPIIQEKFRVLRNASITKDFFLLELDAPALARKCIPGQFVSILVNERNLILRRPFSVFDCGNNSVSIIYKIIGRGTAALSRIEKGASVDVIGPLGNGFSIAAARKHIIVGGGVGIAPLYYLAKNIREAGVAILGAKTKDELICENDFRKLDWKVVAVTEDGSCGIKGLSCDPLVKELEADATNAAIYACGPKGMLKVVSQIAEHPGVRCQVSLEEYMACGVGTCMGCVVKVQAPDGGFEYQRVCKEGPVFDASVVLFS